MIHSTGHVHGLPGHRHLKQTQGPAHVSGHGGDTGNPRSCQPGTLRPAGRPCTQQADAQRTGHPWPRPRHMAPSGGPALPGGDHHGSMDPSCSQPRAWFRNQVLLAQWLPSLCPRSPPASGRSAYCVSEEHWGPAVVPNTQPTSQRETQPAGWLHGMGAQGLKPLPGTQASYRDAWESSAPNILSTRASLSNQCLLALGEHPQAKRSRCKSGEIPEEALAGPQPWLGCAGVNSPLGWVTAARSSTAWGACSAWGGGACLSQMAPGGKYR